MVSLDNLETEPAVFEPEELELLDAIHELPLKYRTILHLYYYEGYSTREIAQILTCSEVLVRKRLSRARDKLKKVLEEGGWI